MNARVVLALVVLLTVGSSNAPAELCIKRHAQLHALVIGVDTYKDPRLPQLMGSVTRSRIFAQFLKERSSAFKDPPMMTILLNDQATRSNIAEAARERLSRANPNDVVIIYFAGIAVVEDWEPPGERYATPHELYFLSYDAKQDNVFGSCFLVNDPRLYRGWACQNVFVFADAVLSSPHRSRYLRGRGRLRIHTPSGMPKALHLVLSGKEVASHRTVYSVTAFTHFLVKGMGGEADAEPYDRCITLNELYAYMKSEIADFSRGNQRPELFVPSPRDRGRVLYALPSFDQPLIVHAQFEYVGDDDKTKPLTKNSILRSGQRVRIGLTPQSNCYVYLLWWDSTGIPLMVQPHARLAYGNPLKAGTHYWFPPLSPGKESQPRWYVLDDNTGLETLYLVVSRKRNVKLESLYSRMAETRRHGRISSATIRLAADVERHIMKMGTPRRLPEKGTNSSVNASPDLGEPRVIGTVGEDMVFQLSFQHVTRSHSR